MTLKKRRAIIVTLILLVVGIIGVVVLAARLQTHAGQQSVVEAALPHMNVCSEIVLGLRRKDALVEHCAILTIGRTKIIDANNAFCPRETDGTTIKSGCGMRPLSMTTTIDGTVQVYQVRNNIGLIADEPETFVTLYFVNKVLTQISR